MSTVVRFPNGLKAQATQPIPREDFERLAELALDIVDRIVVLLDDEDGDPDAKDGADAEPALGAPEEHGNHIIWLRGTVQDLEMDQQEPDACA